LIANYVLLVGPDGAEWTEAAKVATDSLGGLTLDAYCVGKELLDAGDGFARTYGISSAGASLLRPDGFIAWRTHGATTDRVKALREALARSLGN
jgi:putative polyketide hydroxylase